MHLIAFTTAINSVTEGQTDYTRRTALAIRIIVFSTNGIGT